MAASKGNGWGGARSNTGGARPGAGRKAGGTNARTRERKAKIAAAVASGLSPLEFLLKEMRDETLPREQRWLLAKWCMPFIHPHLANIQMTKSVRAMTREELQWAINDAEKGALPGDGAWQPRVVTGGRRE